MKYQKNAKERIEAVLPERGLINIQDIADRTGLGISTVWYNLKHSDKVIQISSGEKKHVYYVKKKCKWTAREISTRLRNLAKQMWAKFENNTARVHAWMQKTSKQLFNAIKELKSVA